MPCGLYVNLHAQIFQIISQVDYTRYSEYNKKVVYSALTNKHENVFVGFKGHTNGAWTGGIG